MSAPFDSEQHQRDRLAALAKASGTGSGTFSHRQLLALRKELLLTRAAIERAELIDSVDTVRSELRGLGWIGFFMRRRGLDLLTGRLIGRLHPMAGTALSLALGSLRGSGKLHTAQRVVRTVAVGVAGLEIFKTWRKMRRRKNARAQARAARRAS